MYIYIVVLYLSPPHLPAAVMPPDPGDRRTWEIGIPRSLGANISTMHNFEDRIDRTVRALFAFFVFRGFCTVEKYFCIFVGKRSCTYDIRTRRHFDF